MASRTSLFGKSGYLGTFTSQAERDIWNDFLSSSDWVRLALTDVATEGKWLITAGPREGLLFWDHTGKQYGPGAAGSGWSKQERISGKVVSPTTAADQDYAMMEHGVRLRTGWMIRARPP